MRGKVPHSATGSFQIRITPAYAGKRTRYWEMCGKYQDHPRLCGEKSLSKAVWLSPVGSPPPMRGKVHFLHKDFGIKRITPAYAGKRQKGGTAMCPRRDHPRLCGEKKDDEKLVVSVKGSPPPMRGKAGQCSVDFPCSRITPAYAGKSQQWL